MTAEPMATPLVMALVVLPTASRLTMTRSASPVNSPDISATPAALSETGPKLSSDTTMPAVDSMPMPVSEIEVQGQLDVAVGQAHRHARWPRRWRGWPTPSTRGRWRCPASTVVAGPVRADSAISRTGRRSVEVKCSVIWLATSDEHDAGEHGVEGLHVVEVEAGDEARTEHGQRGRGPEARG